MTFNIRMGIPEVDTLWKDFSQRKLACQLDKSEERFFKKLVKTLDHLRRDPKHPGLASHEIDVLSLKYKVKIFQSYLENNTPSAGRLFWAYGPNPREITIFAIEPHPEDQKKGAYQRIKLSSFPL